MTDRERRKMSLAEKMKQLVDNKDSYRRRTNKPLTEKRRRERINKCLIQLKSLILKATGKEEKKYSRLEKADILEMTVDHLRRTGVITQTRGVSTDNDENYQQGFNNCATEVFRCLNEIDCIDMDVKSRLLNHLSGSLNRQVPSTKCVYSTIDPVNDINFGSDDVINLDDVIPRSAIRNTNDIQPTSSAIPSTHVTSRADSLVTMTSYPKQYRHQTRDNINQHIINSQNKMYEYVTLPVITSPPLVSGIGLPLHTSTPINRIQQTDFSSGIRSEKVHGRKCLPLALLKISSSSSESSNDIVRNSSDPTSSSDSTNSSDPWRPW